jgi:hypothetical protein
MWRVQQWHEPDQKERAADDESKGPVRRDLCFLGATEILVRHLLAIVELGSGDRGQSTQGNA